MTEERERTVAKISRKQAGRRIIGRFIVADPEICHGQPTFLGTRILVSDVLGQVADGLAWETIHEEWRGSLSYAAIQEAVRMASQAFADHSSEYGSTEFLVEPQRV